MPYNQAGALAYIHHQNKTRPTIGNCARGLIDGIRRGGGLTSFGQNNAKDMGPVLRASGFQPVTDGTLQTGDIEVLQAVPGHKNGHTAMYDENGDWVSDHDQGTDWDPSGSKAYRKHEAQANRVVYRYTGEVSHTVNGHALTNGAAHNVHVGPKKRHMSHKHSHHTAGKVLQGSKTVFVGTGRYAVARVGDQTDDGSPIADGEQSIFVG
jgi:uncharacterized Zn-binding protein involved in type VI secretion